MGVDVDELEARLTEVAADAAHAETMDARDYALLALFTVGFPVVLMVVGWYL